MSNYFQKYSKYKTKYLELKKKYDGGGWPNISKILKLGRKTTDEEITDEERIEKNKRIRESNIKKQNFLRKLTKYKKDPSPDNYSEVSDYYYDIRDDDNIVGDQIFMRQVLDKGFKVSDLYIDCPTSKDYYELVIYGIKKHTSNKEELLSNRRLYDNRDLIEHIMNSSEIKLTDDEIITLIKHNVSYYDFLEVKKESYIETLLISKPEAYRNLSDELKNNKRLILSVLSKNDNLFKYLSNELKNDIDIIISALNINDKLYNELEYHMKIKLFCHLIINSKKIDQSNLEDLLRSLLIKEINIDIIIYILNKDIKYLYFLERNIKTHIDKIFVIICKNIEKISDILKLEEVVLPENALTLLKSPEISDEAKKILLNVLIALNNPNHTLKFLKINDDFFKLLGFKLLDDIEFIYELSKSIPNISLKLNDENIKTRIHNLLPHHIPNISDALNHLTYSTISYFSILLNEEENSKLLFYVNNFYEDAIMSIFGKILEVLKRKKEYIMFIDRNKICKRNIRLLDIFISEYFQLDTTSTDVNSYLQSLNDEETATKEINADLLKYPLLSKKLRGNPNILKKMCDAYFNETDESKKEEILDLFKLSPIIFLDGDNILEKVNNFRQILYDFDILYKTAIKNIRVLRLVNLKTLASKLKSYDKTIHKNKYILRFFNLLRIYYLFNEDQNTRNIIEDIIKLFSGGGDEYKYVFIKNPKICEFMVSVDNSYSLILAQTSQSSQLSQSSQSSQSPPPPYIPEHLNTPKPGKYI